MGEKFEITAIGNGAFKNYSKLSKVTIGSNVKSIGTKAFYNCRKLKTIRILSKKLKKVGNKAIANIYRKAVIKVPSGKAKKYKKLFTKKKGFLNSMKIR